MPTFAEPINTMTGSTTLDVGGAALSAAAMWDPAGQVLTLTPDMSLPPTSTVDVRVSGYEDLSGNALAADVLFSFTTAMDACLGLPPTVTVDSAPQNVSLTAGEAEIVLTFSGAYRLQESDVMVAPVGVAAGRLKAGSLVTADNRTYRAVIENAANDDRYFVTLAPGMTADGCTRFTGLMAPGVIVTLRPILADIMDADGTIIEVFGGMPVPFTDTASGRVLPYSVSYANNEAWPPDMSTTSYREITIPGVAGITIEGTFTTETSFDDFIIADGALNEVFRQDNTFSTPFSVNVLGDTVILAVNSDGSVNGAGYTIERLVYTYNVACLGTPGTITLDTMPQSIPDLTGSGLVRVTLSLDGPFTLSETDITVMATRGGSGALVPGTLVSTGMNLQDWTFDLSGVSPGDAYTIVVAGRSGPCSTLVGGTIQADIIDGRCLGSTPSAALRTSNITGSLNTVTGLTSVPVVFDSPYFLQASEIIVVPTNGGAGVLVPGSLQRTGPSNAPSQSVIFELQGAMQGDTYDVTINNNTDLCGSALTGGTYTVTVGVGSPSMPGMCPIPTLGQVSSAPDACGAPTSASFAPATTTAAPLHNRRVY